jgi:glycosyltransferase involved in cell wall biosynthesis
MSNNTIYDEFKRELQAGLNNINNSSSFSKINKNEIIKIDLHCHDYNSDKPDEILGRILNVPETWLPSESLVKTLEQNGCNGITITNHNNARSCWELKDKGHDILSGAEFSCTVPEYNTGIHVLAYGFTPEQEKVLFKIRSNVYNFQEYAVANNIPTAWAHPLYFYSPDGVPPIDFFEKISLIFERFEIINGQRDTWQNLLTYEWLKTLNDNAIDNLSFKHNINPAKFCKDPYKKTFIGGSDSHMGIFAGLTGTKLHVPGFGVRKDDESISSLALEALRNGEYTPYGGYNNSEKMATAFLDYVCQIALHHKDPGLIRMLLHKGTYRDKVIALVTTNAFAELRRHKITMNFIKLFHNSFSGKTPHFSKKWFVKNDYKPIFESTQLIAENYKSNCAGKAEIYNDSIYSINNQLNEVFGKRLSNKITKAKPNAGLKNLDLNSLIKKLEIPSEFRSYIENGSTKSKRITNPEISKLLDGLSFPFLGSSLILAAHFTSAKVLYNNRQLLNSFAGMTGKYAHPKRMLWLTDTYNDKNGVSMVLKNTLNEIQEFDLPIDILIASNTVKEEPHLKVIKPISEFSLPNYTSQQFRIANMLEIHKTFIEGGYDRVMVSTEGFMGLAALYLKYAFSVKAYFYVHTDWMEFAKKSLGFERLGLNRLRRVLRAFYQNFDDIFVLNSDHKKWLTSKQMAIKPFKVHQTAHWIEQGFIPTETVKEKLFGIKKSDPVLLYTGRISNEKGIRDIISIYPKIKKAIPNIKLVVCGIGPESDKLKESIPDAIMMGWIDRKDMAQIYSSADLLIHPSKFDTFSMVVLESLTCGLPVLAYKSKGPKDILKDEKCGFLVNDKDELINRCIFYFENKVLQNEMKSNAIKRASDFKAIKIMNDLLTKINLI